MAERTPSSRRKKSRSVAWLADIYFRDGEDAARKALEAISPGDMLRNHRVVRRGEAALRTHAQQRDRIRYQSFNPPLWGWPYSILQARFDPAEKDRFMHHGGEEILLPIQGGVSYHFFWSAGGSEPKRKLLPSPVMPGSVVRVDPQIPHHAWAAGDEPAEAWMIIRDLADRTAGTHIDVPPGLNLEMHPRGPHLSAEQLGQGERYALVAWGIAEKIRLSRLRAGLSIRQLAAACQIDAAQLSRIENGSSSSNVSLEVLFRIVRCLGLEIDELFSPGDIDEDNPFKIENIGRDQQGGVSHSVLCTPRRHFLHLTHWNLPEGESIELEDDRRDTEAHRSWIVLKGEAIFDLVDPSSGSTRELVDHDSVVHCRYHAALTSVRALQDLELLQVNYSPRCPDS